FQKLHNIDPGFDTRSTLSFRIALPDREYATRRAAVAAHRAIVDRLKAIPGVTAVSAVTCLPLIPFGYGKTVIPEGVPDDGTLQPRAMVYAVAGGYFETTGMRLLRGRFIDSGDVERGAPVVVVNKALADTVFRNQDPIGRRFR